MDGISDARTLGGGAGAREKWSLTEGATLGGYRVVKPLGRGGMGEVYLAENIQTGVRFALKLLPSDLASDSGFRERFRREAGLLQTLRHEGIVQVLHAAAEDGRFFLTMDCVDGGSLDERLKSEGKLAEDETARIALELCEALGYAHGKGVVHRDIKPANVLLDSGGRARLSDFDLARVVGDDFLKSMIERSISLSTARTDGGRWLSQSDNAIVGTYEYMSPEQKAGRPADERSDIFSLGLMVYRMLTGEKAEGVFDMPSDLGCAGEWDAVVRSALSAKPERRYATVADLAADVKQAAEAIEAERARREEVERRREAEERSERGHAAGVDRRAPASGRPAAARAGDASGRSVSPEARRSSGSRKGLVALLLLLLLVLGGGVTAAVLWRQAAQEAARKEARRREAEDAARRRQRGAAEKLGMQAETILDLGGGVTMDTVLIPAGEFMMGSPASEKKRSDDEGPQRRVRITKPFYMGKHEVTQAHYEQVMDTNPSTFKGADLPVEQVSWRDATEFCRKLSRRTGRTVRLPTEAEWEYACRAGTTTPFHYGSSLGSDQANFDADYPYGGAAKGTDRQKTTSAGSFAANAWGLHDMHGNVWEWCADWYGSYPSGTVSDPTGPANEDSRVQRGGCWNNYGDSCRSASRSWLDPAYRTFASGFRVVASPSPGR